MRNPTQIVLPARLVDMPFNSPLARVDVELDNQVIRVLLGPNGEAILPEGVELPLGKMLQVEKAAQAKFHEVIIDLFSTQLQRRVSLD
jgi:hypothetical protein